MEFVAKSMYMIISSFTSIRIPSLSRGTNIGSPHCEIRLRNGKGIIGVWKKYILLYECRQNQGKKNF